MFSEIIKKVDIKNYVELTININKIKAQYNPDRFEYWKSIHTGPNNEVLNMFYSSHYRFLNQYLKKEINNTEDTAYYKLQKLYGRKDKWIRNKIDKFIWLFESIKKDGCKENIIILKNPLVKNIYNNGFEIFEGHHRYACFAILKIKKIKCKVSI